MASTSTPNFGTQSSSGNNSFYNPSAGYDFYRAGIMSPQVSAENNYWGGGAAIKYGLVDCDPYLKSDPLPGSPKLDPGNVLLPEMAMIAGNYPNPFNPQTQISFNLAQGQNVRIEIFNLLGQKVRTLADRYYNSGESIIIWDGNNDLGQIQASGIYFCRFSGETANGSIKMSLIR